MDIRAILAGLAFAFMWSSAFSAARIIVLDAPPLMALSARFLVAGLIGVALARALGQSWHLTRAQWRATLVFGLCQNALYLGMNFVAMQTVEASLSAIIASAMPLLVALIGWMFLRERLPWLGIAGLVGGFVGVAVIMGGRLGGVGADPFGMLLCVLGALALAVATQMVRGAASGGNVLMIVGLQMLVGAAILVGPALAFETYDVAWSGKLVAAFAYVTLVPGLAATLVWFLLVQRIGAVRAATFHFLNPFFGVAVAAVVLGEALRLTDAIGVVIVMGGILAVQMARAAPATSNPPPDIPRP